MSDTMLSPGRQCFSTGTAVGSDVFVAVLGGVKVREGAEVVEFWSSVPCVSPGGVALAVFMYADPPRVSSTVGLSSGVIVIDGSGSVGAEVSVGNDVENFVCVGAAAADCVGVGFGNSVFRILGISSVDARMARVSAAIDMSMLGRLRGFARERVFSGGGAEGRC